MDTYIIRIYRRDPNEPHGLIGLIEEVGVEEKKPFKSMDELQEILMCGSVKIQKKDKKTSTSIG